MVVQSVCAVGEFKSLLARHGQAEWSTRTRLSGLLALQDFMLRLQGNRRVAVSLDCSHGYVSAFKRTKSANTIREPLAVLCKIGVWRKVQSAINHHVKNSAIYGVTPKYASLRVRVEIDSPPGQKQRLETAKERRDKRLNRKHPWRAQLIRDQAKLGFAPEALIDLPALLSTTKEAATKRALEAILNGKHIEPSPDVMGTIRGTLNGIPKELKRRLRIDGEQVAGCDISHAHHCFLPALLRGRIEHCAGDETRAGYRTKCEVELMRLTTFLSRGDYYEKWCDDPKDIRQRDEVKKFATQLLNMPNERAQRIPLYRKMREKFPCAFAVVEDLKSGHHRNVSKQFHRFTGDVIEAALLRAQALGIPAFPDTDALHVPEKHREVVCKIIGEEMSKATGGVCCKVGGIRYLPPAPLRAASQPSSSQPPMPAIFVLPDVAKANPTNQAPARSSAASELCNDPIVRLAAREFNAESLVEITTAEGRSYKVPLWR